MQKLREFFQNHPRPDVVAVYLFGSRAQETSRPSSDIDIGIILKKDSHLSAREIINVSLELDKHLSPLETDIKILNDLPVHVAHNMLRQALLVYCGDEIADADFREHLVSQYFEIRPLLDEFYKTL